MSKQNPLSDSDIVTYTCHRTHAAPKIDGKLDDAAWLAAPKTQRFVDLVTGVPGLFDTRMAALWDDDAFYVGYWVEEPFVEGHLTKRDSTIFTENDVELFIDGGDCYYEFEINALNTLYEILFVWRDTYKPGSRFDVPELSLLTRDVVSYAGDYDRRPETMWYGTHPRGVRWAFLDWDFPGIQTAVHIDGTLNDSSDIDKGWTVELAFPWDGMKWLANGRSLPPKDGDMWRMLFGRFQKLMSGGQEVQPHPGWALNPTGVYDCHQPDYWSKVVFSSTAVQDLPK